MKNILLYGIAALFIIGCGTNDEDGFLVFAEDQYALGAKDPRGGMQMADYLAKQAFKSSYNSVILAINGEENGKCVKERGASYFSDIEKYKGEVIREYSEALYNTATKYCKNMNGFNQFYEKSVLDEFNKRHDTSITMDDLDGTSEWTSLGIKKEDIPKWIEVGITDSGMASDWCQMGIIDAQIVAEWKRQGSGTVNKVFSWKLAGVTDPKEASGWKDAYAYKECKRYGYTNAEIVKKWKSISIACKDISKWVDYGINNPLVVSAWKEIRVNSPYEIESWKSVGCNSIESVKAWMDVDVFSAEGVSAWGEIAVNVPSDVIKWNKIGIKGPRDTRGWFQNTNAKNINDVMVWINTGVKDYIEALLWRTEMGITDIENIKAWKAIGAETPYQAANMKRKGKKPTFTPSHKEQPLSKVKIQTPASTPIYNNPRYPDCYITNIKEGSTLKMLEKPNSKIVIGYLGTKEELVEMIGCLGIKDGTVWCKIAHNNVEGWVHSDYVALISANYESYHVANIAKNDTLNVRKGMTTKHAKVGELSHDAKYISILSCGTDEDKKGWCKIETPDLTGWVRSKYLAKDL